MEGAGEMVLLFDNIHWSSVMFDTLDNSLYGVTLLSKLLFQPLIIYSTLEKQNTKTWIEKV